jgi:hypothetical protein
MGIESIDLSNIAEGQNIDIWIQAFLLVALVFYSGFALLINKQIKILNKAIETKKAHTLSNLSKANLLGSVILLVIVVLMIIF